MQRSERNPRLEWRYALLALISLIVACQPAPSFHNTDVTGGNIHAKFTLTDHTGQPRQMADFKGKIVALFFGFTHCPDACPTALSEWAQVMQSLEAAKPGSSAQLQVLFVTVDPERDTQALLAEYVPKFDPRFLGLRGDAVATAKLAQEMKVFYQKVPGTRPDTYTIDHTAGSYIFDRQGQVRLFAKHGNPTALLADVQTLLQTP
ncbi:SCO family protein [Parvibium lacunae]|uniref:SCO family protein n=1 Tax=Parvibium lacunae TaxID=1888893 RepID=A0A368L0C7_9BURK|nr:SCO family protein [Parvibium lacunae]RCS56844.1 SCO family protein [Parvibium lacunae]